MPSEAPELIRRILEEHRAPQRPWSRLRVRGALHQLIALLARAHGAAAARPPIGPVVRSALDWMEAHLGEDVAFDALARRSGASPTHFRRLFLREVGEAPSDWLTRRRVERAKELLAGGRAVTEVAHRLGFSSSQYFATVFRRYTGRAPKDWPRG